MNQNIYNQMIQIIDKERVLIDEPMKKHTTFRVGGNADYFVMPRTTQEVQQVVALCKNENLPYYIYKSINAEKSKAQSRICKTGKSTSGVCKKCESS